MWSITYHSWLTFVLLLWACLIWTVRSRHQLAMLCSPCILLYGLALCCLHYVWALDLRPELPTTLGPVSLRQLGLQHTRYPCLDLGAMVSVPLGGALLAVASDGPKDSAVLLLACPPAGENTGEGAEPGGHHGVAASPPGAVQSVAQYVRVSE